MTQNYFPRWKVKTEGTIAPDETLPLGQTLAMGIQHVVIMFGSTVLAPLIMGLDPNVAIFMSGVGTLLFFLIVGGRVPSYLGSSFAFIGVVIAATGYAGTGPNPNIPIAMGGVIACGVVYAIVGLIVMWTGVGWIERLMPPVVTGAIVMTIGLNLAPVAVKGMGATNFEQWYAAAAVLIIMFVLPLLVMFFKEPLTAVLEKKSEKISGGVGMFITQGFFELFEVLLSYFSNTLSFVRVGAFAVSHAAMMQVVLMLAGAEAGSPNWAVVIGGNLFVCGMEGLIVGIQVLRLEYYELFSRFYRGSGRAFEPYGKH